MIAFVLRNDLMGIIVNVVKVRSLVLRNDLMGIIVNVVKVRSLVFPKFDSDGFTQVSHSLYFQKLMNENFKANL